jgi:hypothetical protein
MHDKISRSSISFSYLRIELSLAQKAEPSPTILLFHIPGNRALR